MCYEVLAQLRRKFRERREMAKGKFSLKLRPDVKFIVFKVKIQFLSAVGKLLKVLRLLGGTPSALVTSSIKERATRLR